MIILMTISATADDFIIFHLSAQCTAVTIISQNSTASEGNAMLYKMCYKCKEFQCVVKSQYVHAWHENRT